MILCARCSRPIILHIAAVAVLRWTLRAASPSLRYWIIVCTGVSWTALVTCQARVTKPSRETGLAPADAVVMVWGRVPRPATGDDLGLQHQIVFLRRGGLPVARPMRGDIDDLLSAAC